MYNREMGHASGGVIILLLIAVALAALFLLPVPRPTAAAALGTTPVEASCLPLPAGFSTPAVMAATAPAGLWRPWRYGTSVALNATPDSALLDQPVTIRVTGLTPGEPVTLRASVTDDQQHRWISEATFIADRRGVVDLSHDAPRYGSYSGVHAMGLVWSMRPQQIRDPQQIIFRPRYHASPHGLIYTLTLQALAGQRVLAQTVLNRSLQAPDVNETEIHADGLVGELYTPATPGPHPALVVLGGSEGGWLSSSPLAALLASHGYTALALAYFQGSQAGDPKLASLPQVLMDIPLEYFAQAAAWLRQQPGVDPREVAIIGWSKGAEAALIAAATSPGKFQAVIAFMPSSVVWSGIEYGPGPVSSSWTLHGKPLPWVNPVIHSSMFVSGKPLAFLGAYRDGLKATVAVAQAAIPVENIAAPVLLVSASDDQIWPSSLMAQQIMRRLAGHHHAYHDVSRCYAGAGHDTVPPYRPTNARAAPIPGGSIAFGGDPTADAFANRDSWDQVLKFLHRSLK